MAFDINDFRSRLSGDGARPTLFRVTLTAPTYAGFPTEQFSFMCRTAALPASNVGQIEVPYFGRKIKVAGDRTFDDWTVTAINDEAFDIRDAFERWSNGMDEFTTSSRAKRTDGGTSNPYSYVSEAFIEQFSKEGDVIKTVTLHNCFPTVVGEIALDWESNDTIETFDITFTYDYFTSSGATRPGPGRAF